METELKFALSPEARDRIERHAVALAAGGHGSTEDQSTTYFDTPRRTLRKAGFSLRVRRSADGFVQTVKSAAGSTFRRLEWEWPLDSDDPDLRRLAEVAGLPALDRQDLEPVFRTEIKRTRLDLLPTPGARVELALDDGKVIAGDAGEPVSELELELKGGGQDSLFRLGLDLLQVAPLALSSESKAQRGYRLCDGTLPAAHKPDGVALDRGVGVQEAFARLSANLLDDLLANQPAVLRGDEGEGIHQMRIAIRRLRSLLVLFDRFLEPHAAARFSDELRRLGRALGVARDWDVFLAESLPAVIETAADLKTVEPLRAAAAERRHAAHQAAKKALQDVSFTRFMLAFRAWSHSPEATMPGQIGERGLKEAAPALLDDVARKVTKRLAAADADELATLHALRRSAKKLRYAIEYVDGLYGAAAEPYYKRCSAAQKRLGELNDLATLQRLAEELAADRLDLVPAVAVLENRGAALMARAIDRLDKPLGRLRREKPFW